MNTSPLCALSRLVCNAPAVVPNNKPAIQIAARTRLCAKLTTGAIVAFVLYCLIMFLTACSDGSTAAAQGPAGDTGATGIAGPVGPQGPAGTQGAIGPQGIQGGQGETGLQGIEGPQGLKGHKGDMGAQGTQGFAGAQGTPGAKGDTGTAGADCQTKSLVWVDTHGTVVGPQDPRTTEPQALWQDPIDNVLWPVQTELPRNGSDHVRRAAVVELNDVTYYTDPGCASAAYLTVVPPPRIPFTWSTNYTGHYFVRPDGMTAQFLDMSSQMSATGVCTTGAGGRWVFNRLSFDWYGTSNTSPFYGPLHQEWK